LSQFENKVSSEVFFDDKKASKPTVFVVSGSLVVRVRRPGRKVKMQTYPHSGELKGFSTFNRRNILGFDDFYVAASMWNTVESLT